MNLMASFMVFIIRKIRKRFCKTYFENWRDFNIQMIISKMQFIIFYLVLPRISSITTFPVLLETVLATGYSPLVVAGNVRNVPSDNGSCFWRVAINYELTNNSWTYHLPFSNGLSNSTKFSSTSLTIGNTTKTNLTFIQPLSRGNLIAEIRCYVVNLPSTLFVSEFLPNITVKGKKKINETLSSIELLQ